MRYFEMTWSDEDSDREPQRSWFREGCKHLLPTPHAQGAWSPPNEVDVGALSLKVRHALDTKGFYAESTGLQNQ